MKSDPSTIKNPYQLFAIFLGVVEALLAIWLYQATDSNERITVGILMTIIFVAFLVSVVFIKRTDMPSISPEGLEQVTPAKEEVNKEQIESPGPEKIPGPYGRYIINKPPADWSTNVIHFDDWVTELWGIKDSAIKKESRGTPFAGNILTLTSNYKISILPHPGLTKINGRIFHTALGFQIQTDLTIMDLERVQPPYYFEASLEHNIMLVVSGVANAGVSTLQKVSSGNITKSNRKYYMYEFEQDVKNAVINGESNKDADYHLILLGIEGEVRDHLLVMRYVIMPPPNEEHTDKELETLRNLVSSFQPLKLIEPEKEQQKINKQADKFYNDLWKNIGIDAFKAELEIFFYRLIGENFDDEKTQKKIINQLKMFKVFADSVNFTEKEFDPLWLSLREAENGKFDSLKTVIQGIISSMKKPPK